MLLSNPLFSPLKLFVFQLEEKQIEGKILVCNQIWTVHGAPVVIYISKKLHLNKHVKFTFHNMIEVQRGEIFDTLS